jgi:predicted nucleic acid-binding protein
MIVVSDTSPITTLLQIRRCDLLSRLFDRVLIPKAVETELRRFHDEIPGFIEVRAVRRTAEVATMAQELHTGEAEAIVLAQESKADYLLVDEKRARVVAERRGLRVIGLLGVLLLARRSGFIDSLARAIEDIEANAGFYVDETIKDHILRAAGER